MLKPLFAAALASAALLSGCAGPSIQPGQAPLDALGLANALTLVDKKGFRIDQPTDIYLVGFEDGMGKKLQRLLKPEEVAGAPLDLVINFPPSVEGTTDDQIGEPLPAVPRAVYRVHQLPDTFGHDLFEHVRAHPAPGAAANVYDANAAEEFLADRLPQFGYAWSPDRSAFVVLHAHGHLPADHAWRFTYPNGYLEPVRAFGERHPFLVYDVSARPDPYVVTDSFSVEGTLFRTLFGANEVKAYNYPLEAGGDATAEHLRALTVDATHYRLLQPSIYAVSTKPCHHVTLLMGVHATSLTELAAYGKPAKDLVDVAALRAAFTNLTRDDVTVDLRILALPQDDPVLDAFLRTAGNGALVVFPFLDAMRWYLDAHWEQYVAKQPGCEEYLSLMIFGDAATRGDFGGIGMYDVTHDRRISFSLWPELNRLRATYAGPAEEVVRTSAKSDDPWNRLNLLFSHETGHLFGQHHPQHLQHAEGPSPSIDTFQSVWSVMSYETGLRIIDFGDIDAANWQRNRAGFAVQAAQVAGVDATPEFAAALDALRAYRWEDAHAALEPLLPRDAAAAAYHAGESHAHPEHLALFGPS